MRSPSRVFAIDPGPVVSGFYIGQDALGVAENGLIFDAMRSMSHSKDILAVEMFDPRGMPIGRESLETVFWAGRFVQEWVRFGGGWMAVSRNAVKLMLCGTARAKDANVRQALIDIYGNPGTRKAPGGTYGVKSHAWAAMAVWHYANQILGDDPS